MKKINKKNNPISILKKVREPIGNRIAKAVSSRKKISERIIGYLPYDVKFIRAEFEGKTQRPAKITALEKGIIGILMLDEYASLEKIGSILGLDVIKDTAERTLLTHAIETLRSFNAIEGDDSCVALTGIGREYAANGERPDSYISNFELFIDQNHPSWLNIKNSIGKYQSHINEINTPIDELFIDIDTIRSYAECQATNVHFPQERYLLESASWKKGKQASYQIYVCFVQNLANSDDVRAFVYDENSESINDSFTEFIDQDESLKKELLGQYLITIKDSGDSEIEILQEEQVEEAKAEISEEIKDAEKIMIQEEAEKEQKAADVETSKSSKASSKDRLRKKALYDSLSFELELQKMFAEDDADEIWLISPWIRQKAFLEDRGPMIEAFLQDENKRVFIAYSEPAKSRNDDRPMVDESIEPKIKLLEDQYSNFFYVQLPEFHLKNVVEVKGDQKVLFSGSFNVLSFSVAENETHIRREEMTLAHPTIAKKKYENFQIEFANIYAKRIREQIESLKQDEYENFKNDKLDYFLEIDNPEIRQLFTPIQDMIEENRLISLKSIISKKLASLDQNLVVARNMGGVNARDKKKYQETLSSIRKLLTDNLIIDPSIEEQLNTVSEKLSQLQVKAIFPGKDAKRSPEKTTKTHKEVNRQDQNSYLADARTIITNDNPSSKNDLWKILISLYYLFSQRDMKKGELQTRVKSIVLKLDSLYDGLKIETSPNNSDGINITFIIGDNGISFNTLFLNDIRSELESHIKIASPRRIKWVNHNNIESKMMMI